MTSFFAFATTIVILVTIGVVGYYICKKKTRRNWGLISWNKSIKEKQPDIEMQACDKPGIPGPTQMQYGAHQLRPWQPQLHQQPQSHHSYPSYAPQQPLIQPQAGQYVPDPPQVRGKETPLPHPQQRVKLSHQHMPLPSPPPTLYHQPSPSPRRPQQAHTRQSTVAHPQLQEEPLYGTQNFSPPDVDKSFDFQEAPPVAKALTVKALKAQPEMPKSLRTKPTSLTSPALDSPMLVISSARPQKEEKRKEDLVGYEDVDL